MKQKQLEGIEKLGDAHASELEKNITLRKALFFAVLRLEKNLPSDDVEREETLRDIRRFKKRL